jgi:hypothetical protein
MQNINGQYEEKDGYSNIVHEVQLTAGCSSTILIDVEGDG